MTQRSAVISRDQVKRFYDRLYKPLHFVIAAAGNLGHEGLCALVEEHMETGKRLSTGQKPERQQDTRNGPSEPAHQKRGHRLEGDADAEIRRPPDDTDGDPRAVGERPGA